MKPLSWVQRAKEYLGLTPSTAPRECFFPECTARAITGANYCPEHDAVMDSVELARAKIEAGELDAAYSVDCNDCDSVNVVEDDIGAGHPGVCDDCGSKSIVTTEIKPRTRNYE